MAGLGGVALKLIWVNRFERLSVVLYLFLRWTILVAIEPLTASASLPAIVLLAAGGILYSVGVLFTYGSGSPASSRSGMVSSWQAPPATMLRSWATSPYTKLHRG